MGLPDAGNFVAETIKSLRSGKILIPSVARRMHGLHIPPRAEERDDDVGSSSDWSRLLAAETEVFGCNRTSVVGVSLAIPSKFREGHRHPRCPMSGNLPEPSCQQLNPPST